MATTMLEVGDRVRITADIMFTNRRYQGHVGTVTDRHLDGHGYSVSVVDNTETIPVWCTEVTPVDPAPYDDLPPFDLDACEVCNGTGIRNGGIDSSSGHLIDDVCLACAGTGQRGL